MISLASLFTMPRWSSMTTALWYPLLSCSYSPALCQCSHRSIEGLYIQRSGSPSPSSRTSRQVRQTVICLATVNFHSLTLRREDANWYWNRFTVYSSHRNSLRSFWFSGFVFSYGFSNVHAHSCLVITSYTQYIMRVTTLQAKTATRRQGGQDSKFPINKC